MCLTYESSRCYNVCVNINGSCLPARLEVRSTSGESTVECIYKKPSSNLSVIINALGTVNDSIFYIDRMSKEILQNNLYGVDINPESVEITKLSLSSSILLSIAFFAS